MGIERFYTESIAVTSFTPSATWPYENAWNAVSGSPFKCSWTELSGTRADVGGASEVRADAMACLASSVTIDRSYHVTHGSLTYEIVNIKPISEHKNHHQEVYLKEYHA
jgi:hypothetical protein